MIRVDPFDICSIVTGTFRLDGGAMFGVVPKVLWQNCTDVDDRNRILLATRSLLAVDRSAGRVILVDTGCGTKWEPHAAERFAIQHDAEAIPGTLAAIGLSVDNVTDVVVTHVHFDHNGGLTYWRNEPGGELRLHFPRARHWIHRSHWDHARSPHVRDRASFLPEDFAPLEAAGVLRFLDGEKPDPTLAGVDWLVSHGHTPYQLHPIFGTGSQKLLFAGDLIPTVNHLRLPWVMAYDMEPLKTIEEKRLVYQRCFTEGLWLALPHDPRVAGVALDGSAEKPIVSRALEL